VEITEVRIKLMNDGSDRLKAFCSITFDDCFVIRDLKIIDGSNGPFVAMPSRKLTSHCLECGYKNHLRAEYCNQCGHRQRKDQAAKDDDGRVKLYADIAHPINSECREMIQARVIEELEFELDRAQRPGYTSRYDDFDCDAAEPHFEGGVQNADDRSNKNEPRIEQPEPQKQRGPHSEKKQADHPQPRDRMSGGFGEGIF